MNKQFVYEYLNSRNISYEVTEHKAVYNMDELIDTQTPLPKISSCMMNKKRNYYLITMKGKKRINLKKFRRDNGTRPLSFANENDLMAFLGITPGAVTPLGLLNDEKCSVHLFLDKDFLTAPAIIGIHPNDNTATVWLRTDDLVRVIKEHGNDMHIIEIKDS